MDFSVPVDATYSFKSSQLAQGRQAPTQQVSGDFPYPGCSCCRRAVIVVSSRQRIVPPGKEASMTESSLPSPSALAWMDVLDQIEQSLQQSLQLTTEPPPH